MSGRTLFLRPCAKNAPTAESGTVAAGGSRVRGDGLPSGQGLPPPAKSPTAFPGQPRPRRRRSTQDFVEDVVGHLAWGDPSNSVSARRALLGPVVIVPNWGRDWKTTEII